MTDDTGFRNTTTSRTTPPLGGGSPAIPESSTLGTTVTGPAPPAIPVVSPALVEQYRLFHEHHENYRRDAEQHVKPKQDLALAYDKAAIDVGLS
ncbi:hypothetical protein Q8G41_27260, partial [Klebsiella pneumoniae]|uniref:hypothetical protein n=1 Tax=Klebsiella pneumoniae TaxID=573 RepID=UPI0030134EE1